MEEGIEGGESGEVGGGLPTPLRLVPISVFKSAHPLFPLYAMLTKKLDDYFRINIGSYCKFAFNWFNAA